MMCRNILLQSKSNDQKNIGIVIQSLLLEMLEKQLLKQPTLKKTKRIKNQFCWLYLASPRASQR